MNILFEETKSSIHFSVCSFSMGFSVLKNQVFSMNPRNNQQTFEAYPGSASPNRGERGMFQMSG